MDAEQRMHEFQEEIACFLEDNGWNPVGIGTVSILKIPDGTKLNHVLTIKFTGGKKGKG